MNSSNIRTHEGALLGIALACLTAFRLLAISHYKPETAYAVLATQGTGAVISGTLIQCLPVLPVIFFALLINETMIMTGEWMSRKAVSVSWLSLVVSIFIVPVSIINLFLISIWLIVNVANSLHLIRSTNTRLHKPSNGRRKTKEEVLRELLLMKWRASARRLMSYMVYVSVAAGLFASAASAIPWIPAEKITFSDGTALLGFSLGNDGGDEIFLTQANRLVVRENDQGIRNRTFCNPVPDFYDKVLGSNVTDSPTIVARILFSQERDYRKC